MQLREAEIGQLPLGVYYLPLYFSVRAMQGHHKHTEPCKSLTIQICFLIILVIMFMLCYFETECPLRCSL